MADVAGVTIAALAMMWGSTAGVLAGEDSSTETPQVFGLGEVVVTAAGEERESPTTISEIGAEDIERQSATNLGEALQLLPGVHFRQGRAKNEFYVSVRGFEQENVLILLDGVPIYVPYEGLVNLADIPVQNIAKIKVIKGLASTLYGPNSMGGVINIITKKGTAKPSAALSYQGSDYNTHHAQFTHGWKKGQLSYFIGASHRESDGWALADTYRLPRSVTTSMAASPANPSTLPNQPIDPDRGGRDNSDYGRDAFSFTGNWEASEANTLGLSFEYYKNRYGVPPSTVYREHRRGFFYFPRYYRFSDWERYTINLIDEYQPADSWRLKCRVFYDDYYNVLHSYDDDSYTTQDRIGPASGRSEYDDYTAGFNVYTFWDGIPGNEVRGGITFKRDVHNEQFRVESTDRLASHTYSLSLEDEYHLLDNLAWTLGASYDIFDKRDRRQASDPTGEPGHDVFTVNPQTGISYEFSSTVNLYASAGRKVRFPTMRNLYATGVIGAKGDPNLQEERTYNYEVGGRWNICPMVALEGALFRSDVRDLINFDNQTGRFEQYSRASITGTELTLASQLAETLFGSLSYTFMKAKNHGTVTLQNDSHPALVYEPDYLPYRPQHKVDMELRQELGFGMEIDLNGSYISSVRYYDHADPNDNQRLYAYKKRLDDYVLLDLRISQKIEKHTQVYVTFENLLKEEYQDLYLFPAPGVRVWGGIKLEL
jgi:outer membrane receptor protein involved in Fe transport